MPLVFIAFGVDFITRGNVRDGLGIAGGTVVCVAVMVWMLRNVVDQVEVTEDGIILRVLLGLRVVRLTWRDVVSVMDRGDDAVLQERGGTTYFLSHELSDLDALRERLKMRRRMRFEISGERTAPRTRTPLVFVRQARPRDRRGSLKTVGIIGRPKAGGPGE